MYTVYFTNATSARLGWSSGRFKMVLLPPAVSGYLVFPVFMKCLKQPSITYTHDLVFQKRFSSFVGYFVVFVTVAVGFFPSVWLKLFVTLNCRVGWEFALGM